MYTLLYSGDLEVPISAPNYDAARTHAQRAANEAGTPVELRNEHDTLFTARPQG